MKARLLAPTFAVVSIAALLSSCGHHKEKADQRTSSGQVLQGTINDDMLPLATVTSQPPRMKVQPSAAASEAAQDQEATAVEDSAEAADDTPPTGGTDTNGD